MSFSPYLAEWGCRSASWPRLVGCAQVCARVQARSEYLLRASLLCSRQNGRWQLPMSLSLGLNYTLHPHCVLLHWLAPNS